METGKVKLDKPERMDVLSQLKELKFEISIDAYKR